MSEEEAKKKIYNVSYERYFGFGCQIDEETSNKLEGLPGVLFVLPVSQFPLMWISGFLFLSYKNSGISSLSMAAKTFNFILFLPLLSLVVGHGTMELVQYPLVVSTWPFVEAVRAAWRAVDAGSSAVDSVVGCSACEELRCDGTAIKLWKA